MSLDVWDGIFIGIYLGVFIGWWWNRKPPEYKVIVNQDVLSTMTTQMAMDWAERRNLTWMPKGAVFDPNRTIVK